MHARLIALLIAAAGILAALPAATAPARAAPSPTLTILAPAADAVIGNGTPVAVLFTVTDFNLTAPGTGGSTANAGHVEVSVDGALVAEASANTVLLPLPSGPHTILLRLVTDNGSALLPDVTATVPVLVTQGPAGGTPAIAVTYPEPGAIVGTDLWVGFRVTGFALVPVGSGLGVPGEGHVHVFLDGADYTDVTNAEPVHFNLNDGPHNVTFVLVDSGSNPLAPNAAASVAFTVRALVGRIIPPDYTTYIAGANVLLGLAILAAMYRRLEA